MITEQLVYKCECDKCGYIWTPKTNTVPARCASCNVKTWHDQTGEITVLDTSIGRLSYDSICRAIDAMPDVDRETLLDEWRPREVAKPSQPMQDAPKDDLAAFIAKAQAKKGIAPEPITVEADPVDEWAGWGKEEQTYDDQTGEMRTFRRHIKSGRVKWLDAETWFG